MLGKDWRCGPMKPGREPRRKACGGMFRRTKEKSLPVETRRDAGLEWAVQDSNL